MILRFAPRAAFNPVRRPTVRRIVHGRKNRPGPFVRLARALTLIPLMWTPLDRPARPVRPVVQSPAELAVAARELAARHAAETERMQAAGIPVNERMARFVAGDEA